MAKQARGKRLELPVTLISCLAPSFAVPCEGVLVEVPFSTTGSPMNNWATFRRTDDSGQVRSVLIRNWKVKETVPHVDV